jgi:hypothetical protein
MNPYYFWLVIFAFFLYLILTDESVASFVVLISRLFRFWFEKTKWWLIHNPANPIVKYLMWRRAWKLAKDLQNEIQMERKPTRENDNR